MAARFTRAATAVVVAAGLLTAVAADARPRTAAPDVRQARSVPGTAVPARPLPPDPTERWAAGAAPVRWPAPGAVHLAATAGGPARAGAVTLRHANGGAPATSGVRVQVLDRPATRAAGVDGVLLRADGPAALEVDYGGFRAAYGGDWASRLRLVRLPDCALASPASPECRRQEPVRSRNDAVDGRITGEVTAGVYAVTAGASGGSGSYAATPLTPAASWQVSTQSGDFGWSYPFRVPPVAGDLAPDLALRYSAGSIDGQTVATNNQPSWIGQGFELSPGYVERQYKACADDDITPKTGDLCWGTDNATLVLGGRSTALVKDAATGAWHPEEDDAERVELATSASNGDNNGEWWKVTTSDGTQYLFGRYAQTKSVWTVPVYGDDAGEPCHASTFASSSCSQAWRWQLDRVVDVHGNAIVYFYERETNYYGANLGSTGVSYVRGGWLSRVEYGHRSGTEFTATAPAKVVFGVSERCLTNCGTLSSSTASNWPDVPYDQNCDAGASCDGKHTPTFWSRKRLTTVATQVWNGSGHRDVDSWTLTQTFPAHGPGDPSGKALWLDKITHTGKVGGALALPAVSFAGVQRENRVDADEGIDPMTKWRVGQIQTETGGLIEIDYSVPTCSRSALPAPESNTQRCFPQYWTPEGSIDPIRDWFHKYVVQQVAVSDPTGGNLPTLTAYEYVGGTAWAYDDNPLVPANRRSWSRWRGFEKVRVVGGEVTGQRSLTYHQFFRGMDGDHLPGGGVRDVKITDSTGAAVDDHPRLHGFERESIVYNGPGGAEVSGTINDPWLRQTAANGSAKAYLLETEKVRGRTALAAGGARQTEVRSEFDTLGVATRVSDLGDLATTADDRCTTYTYARNTSVWLLAPLSREEVVSVACGSTVVRPDNVISDVRNYHDSTTIHGTAAVRGDVTKVEKLASWSGGPVYVTASRSSYDIHGRVTEAFDAADNRSTTTYTPPTGSPVTQTVATNPLGHATTTSVEPAWGSPLSTVDANGKRTELAYDPLGRLASVWLPGRARTLSPSLEFAYLVRTTGPVAVTTRTLRNDGSYRASHALYDALLRPRQTQAPAPGGGRVVTDTYHDSRGLVARSNAAYYNDQPPATELLAVADWQVPQQTVTVYDGAGRATDAVLMSLGAEKWRTTTTYGGDRVDVDPPAGGTATTTVSDARGRTVELRQYHGTAPTGSYDATRYSYWPAGQLATVTDSAGNVWRYAYDLRGRKVRTEDPDRGASILEYDDLDRLVASTDARGFRLATTYDTVGRKIAVYEGSTAGPQLLSWSYDSLAKGHPTSSTRHVGTTTYVAAVTGYDDAYRPLGTSVTIPAAEGALAGTYTSATTYNLDGTVDTVSLPRAGANLNAETLKLGYNELAMPATLRSLTSTRWYVSDTEYHKLGMPLRHRHGEPPGLGIGVIRAFGYEESTNRVTRAFADRELLAGTDPAKQRETDVAYGYDPAGNIVSIVDTPASPAPADAQCFRYDHLRRMTEAWTPAPGACGAAPSLSGLAGPAPYWHSYSVDSAGSRRMEVQHAAAGDTTRTYSYPATGGAQPHTLRSVGVTGPGGPRTDSYGYDATGNLTSRTVAGVAQTLEWDKEGRVSGVLEGTKETTFLYDASGARLIRRAPDAVTLYLGEQELRLDRATNTVIGTRYYSFGSTTIAVRNNNNVFTWLVGNHQGTAQLSITNTGSSVQRRYFTPFGDKRGTPPTSWIGDRGFVGGNTDASTGLTHLGAREYEPATGRFVSVDPVIDHNDPQQMHGYAYANNSPVTFSDPTGLLYPDGGGGGGSSSVSAGQFREAEEASKKKYDEMQNKRDPVIGGGDGRGPRKPPVACVDYFVAACLRPSLEKSLEKDLRLQLHGPPELPPNNQWLVQPPCSGMVLGPGVGINCAAPDLRSGPGSVTDRKSDLTPFATLLAILIGLKYANPDDKDYGISVYRAPRKGQRAYTMKRGLNPAWHRGGHAFVGSEDVAQEFAGRGGYEPGYVEFRMKPRFEQEFARYFHRYGGRRYVSWEYEIPEKLIPRFNSLIEEKIWHDYAP